MASSRIVRCGVLLAAITWAWTFGCSSSNPVDETALSAATEEVAKKPEFSSVKQLKPLALAHFRDPFSVPGLTVTERWALVEVAAEYAKRKGSTGSFPDVHPVSESWGSAVMQPKFEKLILDLSTVRRISVQGRVGLKGNSKEVSVVEGMPEDRLNVGFGTDLQIVPLFPFGSGSRFCLQGRVQGLAQGYVFDGDVDRWLCLSLDFAPVRQTSEQSDSKIAHLHYIAGRGRAERPDGTLVELGTDLGG